MLTSCIWLTLNEASGFNWTTSFLPPIQAVWIVQHSLQINIYTNPVKDNPRRPGSHQYWLERFHFLFSNMLLPFFRGCSITVCFLDRTEEFCHLSACNSLLFLERGISLCLNRKNGITDVHICLSFNTWRANLLRFMNLLRFACFLLLLGQQKRSQFRSSQRCSAGPGLVGGNLCRAGKWQIIVLHRDQGWTGVVEMLDREFGAGFLGKSPARPRLKVAKAWFALCLRYSSTWCPCIPTCVLIRGWRPLFLWCLFWVLLLLCSLYRTAQRDSIIYQRAGAHNEGCISSWDQ